MAWIEMARDQEHGGGDWAFLKCIWSPTLNRVGGRQPWWENNARVRAGDKVLHLKGVGANAAFIGFSTCLTDSEITSRRPPTPGEWDYASQFYRTPIGDFEPFDQEINLEDVFTTRDVELRAYFEKNRNLPFREKLSLFYVIQSGRLQCQNGAYLSEADADLLEILLGIPLTTNAGLNSGASNSARVFVSERLATVLARIRQSEFSAAVRNNYRNRCCFPGCNIDDARFLIGAHIARWSDVPDMRGEVSNGLCLCLMHDRAFEHGLFTVDDFLNVRVLARSIGSSWASRELMPYDGEPIRKGSILPSDDALLSHWMRVGF